MKCVVFGKQIFVSISGNIATTGCCCFILYQGLLSLSVGLGYILGPAIGGILYKVYWQPLFYLCAKVGPIHVENGRRSLGI